MYHFDVKLKTTQIVFSLSITNRVNNYIRLISCCLEFVKKQLDYNISEK